MIVRINQLALADAEQLAGWPDRGLSGPVQYEWPEETHAVELLILDVDEKRQPLGAEFRLRQLRQLIPQAIAALKEPSEEIAVRLDGPIDRGQLLGALDYVARGEGCGRYALSAIQRFEEDAAPPVASLRIHCTVERLGALCADPSIGLERDVRLRAFAVPEALLNPLLDIADLDDERWEEILPQAGLILSTTRSLGSLQLLTRRLSPPEIRQRLMGYLLDQAQSGPAL
jgi:hypothetical protein